METSRFLWMDRALRRAMINLCPGGNGARRVETRERRDQSNQRVEVPNSYNSGGALNNVPGGDRARWSGATWTKPRRGE